MNTSKKTILIGGNGMIGRCLVAKLPPNTVVTTSRHESGKRQLNLADFKTDNLKFIHSGDTVLLTAAISSPDICKQQPKLAYAVNVSGTKKLISHCLSQGAKVVFFSSDTVYGETTSPAKESQALTPVGDYARMKANVEEHFHDTQNFLALRLSYVISKQDKFTHYLSECADKNRSADLFHPLLRNAVWIGDLLEVIINLTKKWPTTLHTLNIGGPTPISRIDIADAFSRQYSPLLTYNITKPTADFYSARPVNIFMNIEQLTHYLGRKPYNVDTAYLKELKG
ncbi:MAG: sugar nucleotide-binding protein [Gammaproteobacteria bacterium]|nr:sugar nucleotide-binding protein [Gammaproteobacteria bacterium]